MDIYIRFYTMELKNMRMVAQRAAYVFIKRYLNYQINLIIFKIGNLFVLVPSRSKKRGESFGSLFFVLKIIKKEPCGSFVVIYSRYRRHRI